MKTERSIGPRAPSGAQYRIVRGLHDATVTEVGATLRRYTVDGVDVIDGFELDERSSAGRGQVLAPWPNRLDHGHYVFEGTTGRAAIDEPELSNAIHGMVRWMPWDLVAHSTDRVHLGCVVHPQPGYPWRLELRVEYRLGEDGLTVTADATNPSDAALPFGIGFHPYLTVGTSTVDTAHLLLRLTGGSRPTAAGCPSARWRWPARSSTSLLDDRSGQWTSTRPTPAWSAVTTAGRASGSTIPPAGGSTCGSTTPLVTSWPTRATRCNRWHGGGRASPSSP